VIRPPSRIVRRLVLAPLVAKEPGIRVPRAVDGFEVAVIPHTWNSTTVSRWKVGDPVNLEVDVIAKYVERLLP